MDKASKMVVTAIALLIVSTQVTAQKVYKCKASDGSTLYQQVQCADEDGELVKLPAQPSQATIEEAQARVRAENAIRDYERSMRAASQAVQYYEPAPVARRSRSRQSTVGAQPAVNPSRFDPERVGFSSTRGYESLRHRSPNTSATRTGPGYTEPSRVQDQYGNGYIRPPGSNFVTEERTGRQCVAVGGTIRCE